VSRNYSLRGDVKQHTLEGGSGDDHRMWDTGPGGCRTGVNGCQPIPELGVVQVFWQDGPDDGARDVIRFPTGAGVGPHGNQEGPALRE
jgi:hypothetical protein